MLKRVAVVVAMLISLPSGDARADGLSVPARALRDDERLNNSIYLSDAICRARLLSIADTLIRSEGESWAAVVQVRFKPLEWFKVSGPTSVQTAWTNGHQLLQAKLPLSPAERDVFLFLLRPLRPGTTEDWWISDGPYGVPAGCLPETAKEDQEGRIVHRLELQSEAWMTRRADVVALVRAGPNIALRPTSDSLYTTKLFVDSVLVGRVLEDSIVFQTPVPVLDVTQHKLSVAFLKKAASGQYHPVIPIGAVRGLRSDADVSALIERIARVGRRNF